MMRNQTAGVSWQQWDVGSSVFLSSVILWCVFLKSKVALFLSNGQSPSCACWWPKSYLLLPYLKVPFSSQDGSKDLYMKTLFLPSWRNCLSTLSCTGKQHWKQNGAAGAWFVICLQNVFVSRLSNPSLNHYSRPTFFANRNGTRNPENKYHDIYKNMYV